MNAAVRAVITHLFTGQGNRLPRLILCLVLRMSDHVTPPPDEGFVEFLLHNWPISVTSL